MTSNFDSMDTIRTGIITNYVMKNVWKSFENMSLTHDITNFHNASKIADRFDDNYIFENPAKFGIVTSLLIAWLVDIKILPDKINKFFRCLKLNTIAITVFNLITCLIFGPVIALFLSILFVYRNIINTLLKLKLGNKFKGLLEGADCVWAVEDKSTLSIINIFAVLELDYFHHEKNFLIDFRNLIKQRLLSSSNYEKFLWQRKKKYGYYYWKKIEININDHIKWLDENHEKNCDGNCSDIYGEYLRGIISEKCNKPLPVGNSSCWEIFVGKNCHELSGDLLENEFINYKKSREIGVPLLFRVHHTVGDGVALLRLLLEAISDLKSKETKNEIIKIDENFFTNKNLSSSTKIFYYSKSLLKASMPFSSTITEIIFVMKFMGRIIFKIISKLVIDEKEIFRFVKKIMGIVFTTLCGIISIPSCLISQAMKNRGNKSAIHGEKLSGKKIISCWVESDFPAKLDENLTSQIRDVKNYTGTKFSDVILAVLSSNIHKHFNRIGARSPEKLTTVIPTRMTAPSKKLKLQNRFSVGLLPLCISRIREKTYSNSMLESFNYEFLEERLRDVSESSKKLKNSADCLINYWIISLLAALLPEKLLSSFLQSHSTMIFSNLPGPRQVTLIMGQRLKKIAFFVPNRGTTGIGFSCLTYDGSIAFSIIADTSVIPTELLLDDILRGTVDDIKKLHNYYLALS